MLGAELCFVECGGNSAPLFSNELIQARWGASAEGQDRYNCPPVVENRR
jgi:hypothetical protein